MLTNMAQAKIINIAEKGGMFPSLLTITQKDLGRVLSAYFHNSKKGCSVQMTYMVNS